MVRTQFFSFSLRTLFLLLIIAALSVSHFVLFRQLRDAQEEIESVRKRFGYLRIGDPKLVHISQIDTSDSLSFHSYRLHIPRNHRFVLCIAETELPTEGLPKPSKEIFMRRDWGAGGDVMLSWRITGNGLGVPELIVSTDNFRLPYSISAWTQNSGSIEGSTLEIDGQRTFTPEEPIHFMSMKNTNTNVGVMFWMQRLQP